MMMRSVAIAGLAILFVTPLLAEDSRPSSDTAEPDAQVTFFKGYKNGFGVSGAQVYGISQKPDCSNIQYLDKLSWWTAGSRLTRVAGGQRVYVVVSTTYFYSRGISGYNYGPIVNVGSDACSDSASFITEVGHSYSVTDDAPLHGQCTMRVTDVQTGETPASLQKGPPESCVLSNSNSSGGGGSGQSSNIPH